MKAVKVILGVVGILILAVLGLAMTKSDTMHVERSIDVNIDQKRAYDYVSDMNNWAKWSPWQDKDPNMTQTLSGTPSTVGHKMVWDGNDDVGSGVMTIKVAEPSQKIVWDLEFIKPWEGRSDTSFLFTKAAKGTTLTWTMDSTRSFGEKVFAVFMNMEEMIGADYDKGLEKLKKNLEALPPPAVEATNQLGHIGLPKGFGQRGIGFKPNYGLLPKGFKKEAAQKLNDFAKQKGLK